MYVTNVRTFPAESSSEKGNVRNVRRTFGPAHVGFTIELIVIFLLFLCRLKTNSLITIGRGPLRTYVHYVHSPIKQTLMQSFVSESLDQSVDLDELVRQWEAAYTLKEQEYLRERYASNLRELEFYKKWRRENQLARWEPKLFVDS
jgi:hypothetical protein